VVVGVGNKQFPLRGVQTETTRLRELSVLKRTVDKTALTRPGQGGAPFGCRVNDFYLGQG
jgi:hypothetical protein